MVILTHSYLLEDAARSWVQQNRLKLRQKFLQRHEENIEKERKAGIKKGNYGLCNELDYKPISERAQIKSSNRSRPATTYQDVSD